MCREKKKWQDYKWIVKIFRKYNKIRIYLEESFQNRSWVLKKYDLTCQVIFLQKKKILYPYFFQKKKKHVSFIGYWLLLLLSGAGATIRLLLLSDQLNKIFLFKLYWK